MWSNRFLSNWLRGSALHALFLSGENRKLTPYFFLDVIECDEKSTCINMMWIISPFNIPPWISWPAHWLLFIYIIVVWNSPFCFVKFIYWQSSPGHWYKTFLIYYYAVLHCNIFLLSNSWYVWLIIVIIHIHLLAYLCIVENILYAYLFYFIPQEENIGLFLCSLSWNVFFC